MQASHKKCADSDPDTGFGHPVAVIDIGSNSVRLVVYDGVSRHPHVVFNEKVLCGLGRNVGKTGRMDDEAIDSALATLRRFAGLCHHMNVETVSAVATAAVREAENGPDLVARIREECQFNVRVLNGEDEARYSAYGVLSGIPDAIGVVGDLGGGSLELIRIKHGRVGEAVSLPIGPVRLLGDIGSDPVQLASRVEEAIGDIDWLAEAAAENFYIVGGAWRAISRIHMQQIESPLAILQGFSLSGSEARRLCKVISSQHPQGLRGIPGVPSRRLEVLPLAAHILFQVISAMQPRSVVTSSLGLREGLLYDFLEENLAAEDPFISECRALAGRNSRFPDHGDTLMAWIDPVFDKTDLRETDEDRRLRLAACLLSDISWRGHPDYRAERAVAEVLFGRFVGIDHRGRAMVALALNQCYGASPDSGFASICLKLLTEQEVRQARITGAALRLCQRLTAGSRGILDVTCLEREGGVIRIRAAEKDRDLVGEVVCRRLDTLAGLLEEQADVTLV